MAAAVTSAWRECIAPARPPEARGSARWLARLESM